MLGVFATPFVGRLVDGAVPWTATVISTLALIVFQAIQTGAGGLHVAVVIIVCFGIDVFRQMQQVSLTTAVFGIDPKARSRLNSVILISVSSDLRGPYEGANLQHVKGVRGADHGHVCWHGSLCQVWLASSRSTLRSMVGVHTRGNARAWAAL